MKFQVDITTNNLIFALDNISADEFSKLKEDLEDVIVGSSKKNDKSKIIINGRQAVILLCLARIGAQTACCYSKQQQEDNRTMNND